MEGPGGHDAESKKPVAKEQLWRDFTYTRSLESMSQRQKAEGWLWREGNEECLMGTECQSGKQQFWRGMVERTAVWLKGPTVCIFYSGKRR